MSKKCARSFNVLHEGEWLSYEAGDNVPDPVAKTVTNPKIWQPYATEEELLEAAQGGPQVKTNIAVDEPFFEDSDEDPLDNEDPDDDDENEEDDDEVEDEFTGLTVAQLREHAENEEIDLDGATRKDEILAVLRGQ